MLENTFANSRLTSTLNVCFRNVSKFRFCVFFPPLSVLKTFLHDPLVEWSKQAKGPCKTQANETGEIVNEKVCIHV